MHPDTKKDLLSIAKNLSLLVLAVGVIPLLVVTYKTETWFSGTFIGGLLTLGVPMLVSGLVAIFVLRSLYRVIRS